ncbi:MAG: 30S ribosomal protein S1 [Spirochaetaceae bacterium]|jgi:small subunit ribosomal protein S1|nr:30S ribosomal protein S1 [Spirochaetaceae bacterium]
MVIAIDGPAGSGKSTLAKLLAERLGYVYINSGNLYRAISLGVLQKGIDVSDREAVVRYARSVSLEYRNNSVRIDGEDMSSRLHSDAVDKNVSALSSIEPVRHLVNDKIKTIAKKNDIVAEGRDMTTVVFPYAEARFYLDASVQTRARRRFDQGTSKLSLEEIKKSIMERDEQDRHKTEGSLIRAPGVRYIDTSLLTIEETYVKIIESIHCKGNAMSMEVVVEESVGKEPLVPMDENQTQLQEEFLKSLDRLEEGQVVDGKIVAVTHDQVFIDVGYKSEGKLPLSEFSESPKIGDAIQVVLVTKENKYGELIVSKQRADEKILWRVLKTAFTEHTAVEGTVGRLVKGGYEVVLGEGTTAFMPLSQGDLHRIDEPEVLLGQHISAYVERLYSDGKVNVVVNRRKFLEDEIERKRDAFFNSIEIGTEVDGVVKSFTSFGAFVDIGGFDGLLHINDMSWGHVVRPKDFVKKGQSIKVKVLRIEPHEKRINLSLKHFTDDPWVHFADKYHVNDIVTGKVTKIADFGAFIELEEGIEGLAHISEFSWVKKIQKPEDLVSIGDTVECMVLGYDLQAGRVSLGLKQVTANPWSDIEEKYPLGTRLKRPVVKITGSGAFVELEEGIDGFLHGDDISWTKKVKHIGSEMKVGDELEVMVIHTDGKNMNIKLGIKQLTEDPWKSFAASYKIGSIVEGEVSSITDFGLFVRVPGGIEGLIHKTNLVQKKEDNPDDVLKTYNVGDAIKALVFELQPDKQKLAFSLRDYQKKMERDEISRYMSGGELDGSTFTLGDALKSKGSS